MLKKVNLHAVSPLGFAPLGWWSLSLLAFAGLIWLIETVPPLSGWARVEDAGRDRYVPVTVVAGRLQAGGTRQKDLSYSRAPMFYPPG